MMLTPEMIQNEIASLEDVSEVTVTGDGYHFQAVVVSDQFQGLSRVARQQWVYAKLKPWISSGELHAISMQTWTKSEWEKQRG
jgi:acid stress-induced BolA-like protein IbaG/YrbA